MELKRFIKESIIEIADGLSEGHKYVTENHSESTGIRNEYRKIEFDIAVASNEEKTTGIDGKISVAKIFNVGGKNEAVDSISNYSRIKFYINIDISM